MEKEVVPFREQYWSLSYEATDVEVLTFSGFYTQLLKLRS